MIQIGTTKINLHKAFFLVQQQKYKHNNAIDKKHTKTFLTFSVQHQISQSHLHIVLAMLLDPPCPPPAPCRPVIGAKSNCSCRPELQPAFTVLSDTPTSGKTQNMSQNKTSTSGTQGCSDTVCLHIRDACESQSRDGAAGTCWLAGAN